MDWPGVSISTKSVRVNTEFGLWSVSLKRSSADWPCPAENNTNMPSAGSMRVSPLHADGAFARDCEGIVTAGVEDQDHRRGALLLQAVREAVRGEGGVAHQALLSRARNWHIHGEQIVVPSMAKPWPAK
jgi:hypothetical protein